MHNFGTPKCHLFPIVQGTGWSLRRGGPNAAPPSTRVCVRPERPSLGVGLRHQLLFVLLSSSAVCERR
ncbi:hypothetical protein Q5P01_009714 [Channa striata]|uniref:Uncharacterized protein n=1 Tax=Channa striata TaxID=64152 RepID=A0AA88SSI6_CHASR|nr:hypothetical protein Q5P01_009714 [Channa striata]